MRNIGGVTTRQAGARFPIGFGYVALPKDVDRAEYVKNCHSTNTITVVLENGGWIDNTPVPKGLFNQIDFPVDSESLGSQVIWGNISMTGFISVIAVISKRNEVIPANEYQFIFQRRTIDGLVKITGDGKKQFLNFTVSSSKGGKGVMNFSVSNPDKDAQLNIDVKGSKNTTIEGSENKKIVGETTSEVTKTTSTIIGEKFTFAVGSDSSETTITIEKDSGITVEDQYGNKVVFKSEGIFINDGNNGGLINIKDLVTQINKVENTVNNILTTLKTTIIPLAPSGTYSFAPLYSAIMSLINTQQNQIEDTKVKH